MTHHAAGFVLTLALLAPPLGTSAQDADDAATSQQGPDGSARSDEPARDTGTLSPRLRKRTRQQWDPDAYELRLDSSGFRISPPAPRHKTDARARQYRQGLIVSSVFIGIGGGLIGGGVVVLRNWQNAEPEDPGLFELDFPPAGVYILFTLGSVAALGGIIGAAISGSKLRARKRKLRELDRAHHGTPRRIQWDLARSQFVF